MVDRFSPPTEWLKLKAQAESSPMTTHTEHVRNLALTLFDRTRPLHSLGDDYRNVLEWAVRLHDIPLPRQLPKSRQEIQARLQSHDAPPELSTEEKDAIAFIVCLHRKRLTRKSLRRLSIPAPRERAILTLAALLRISAALNESGSQQTSLRQVDPVPSGILLVVDGPQATADSTAAQKEAEFWTDLGYPPIHVLEAGQLDAWQQMVNQPPASIGLQPSDALSEAGRKVMRYHFAAMLSQEEATRLGENIEALHDMRVATRRLRAAFEVFQEAFQAKALKPHLKGLRQTGRTLGAVRDLDVFIDHVQKYAETLPEAERSSLSPLLDHLKVERDQARVRMLAWLDSLGYAFFKYKFSAFLNTPGAGACPVSQEPPLPNLVRELAPVLIYTRLAGVRAFEPFLENAPFERLHALRIEFKKLRYTVEYFREALGKETSIVIEDLKTAQDHLGELNDAHISTQLLSQFLEDMDKQQALLPISQRRNPGAIVSYLASRYADRHNLMLSFKETWKHFNRSDFRKSLSRAISRL
jgi:CHAD domain-containing protein